MWFVLRLLGDNFTHYLLVVQPRSFSVQHNGRLECQRPCGHVVLLLPGWRAPGPAAGRLTDDKTRRKGHGAGMGSEKGVSS